LKVDFFLTSVFILPNKIFMRHRASNPVSVKNLTATETSTFVKLLRPYVPVGTKRTSNFRELIQCTLQFHVKLSFVSSLLSSVGSCIFRTIISHQSPLNVIHYILSLMNFTFLTPVRKSLSLCDD
jgi:hypothetical protein